LVICIYYFAAVRKRQRPGLDDFDNFNRPRPDDSHGLADLDDKLEEVIVQKPPRIPKIIRKETPLQLPTRPISFNPSEPRTSTVLIRPTLKRPTSQTITIDDISNLGYEGVYLDRYTLVNSIQCSKNTIVFANDSQTGKKVVLKFYSSFESFENEALMMQYLRSDSVVELYNLHRIVDNNEKEMFMSTIECCGENLEQLMKRKRYNLNDQLKKLLVKALADCIVYLHGKGVVHSDIKPSNFVHETADTTVWKLIDFESSKFNKEENIAMVTPRYCSPEIIAGSTLATCSMDMWSFGCILFELYAGTPFNTGSNDEESIRFLKDFNDSHEFTAVSDAQVRNILKKLLVRNPQQRLTITGFMKSSFMNSGLDTVQLNTYGWKTAERVSNQLVLLDRKTDMVLSKLDDFKRQLLDIIEYDVPRLFVVLPHPNAKQWYRPKYF
jgi:hypothetical protein